MSMNQESWKCRKESTVFANAFHPNTTASDLEPTWNVVVETNQRDWEWITIAEQRQEPVNDQFGCQSATNVPKTMTT